MKKINYVYYIILSVIMCAIVIFRNCIVKMIGAVGFFGISFLYELYLMFSQHLYYVIVRKKGVKDDFCITYQYKFEWSTFWVDTIHNELACLCMFNPFKIQYVSLGRIHDANVKIWYSCEEQIITCVTIHFYKDGKRKSFRVKQHRYGWDNTKENVEILTEDARKLVEIINNKPIQM